MIPYPRHFADLVRILAPPERMPLSAWAEKHFVLSPEYSAKTNLIELEPYQRGILDLFSDPTITQITLMVATQMVKTLFMQIAMANAICEDPGPILFVAANAEDAAKFSKERFSPMARDIEPLNARISPAKSRDTGNTIEHKVFPGGSVDFVGSISPSNLARRTIRYLFCDEIDKWDASAGDEGDPISLARQRQARFGSRRKTILACSPTMASTSRIAAEYERSDMRKPYVGCPFCGHMQILGWQQVRFNSNLPPALAGETARYHCIRCDTPWTEADRRRAVSTSIEWRAHAVSPGHAGVWVSHLYSPLALHSLAELTKTWLHVHDKPNERKVFINTDLAEVYEDEGERPQWERLQRSAETYRLGPKGELDEKVVAITAGVDQQAKRLEVQVLGFGPDEAGDVHTYCLDYVVIELWEADGTPILTSAPAYWKTLEGILRTKYKHPSGVGVPILVMSIDAGFNPEPVYTFAKRNAQVVANQAGLFVNEPMSVMVIRGHDADQYNAIHRVTDRETARQRQGTGQDIRIITLGTGFLKSELYSELLGREDLHRIHLSAELREDYFRGLVAERKSIKSRTGQIEWLKVFPRNEPLDTWVYARGGFYALRADKYTADDWNALRRRLGLPEKKAADGEQVKKPDRLRRSSYLQG